MGAADAPTMTGVLMSQDAKSNAYISGLGLAEAFFGRVQKVHGMVDHSAELYGQAMRSLRDDLQIVDRSAARARAYMNLWTCVFLGLYEMVSTSGSSNWMQHSRGFGALTQLLGPEAFQSVVAKSILEMNRSTIVRNMAVGRGSKVLTFYRLLRILSIESTVFWSSQSGRACPGRTTPNHDRLIRKRSTYCVTLQVSWRTLTR